jgi:hypothetical protein
MLVYYMVIRWHNMSSFSFREFKDVTLQDLACILLCTIQRKLETVQARVFSLLKWCMLRSN